ncbi:unnamed protein product [Wuchereria bancrofti]|nr:unnamed protein product [Wuchereria bancrofti]
MKLVDKSIRFWKLSNKDQEKQQTAQEQYRTTPRAYTGKMLPCPQLGPEMKHQNFIRKHPVSSEILLLFTIMAANRIEKYNVHYYYNVNYSNYNFEIASDRYSS